MLKVTLRRGAPAGAVLFMVLLVIGLNLAIYCGLVWVGGSFVTSVVKAATNSCGSRLAVEKVLSADWFCPDDKS